MKTIYYRGYRIELEEFDQAENGGTGITWTSYVYDGSSFDYIEDLLISADSAEELEKLIKTLIDKESSNKGY